MIHNSDNLDCDFFREGGTVLSTGCTEEYTHGYAEYHIFGVPVWWRKTSPRNAIQPRVSPGECWAFKGSQGYLVLRLSHVIHVTGFTVEHIHKSISVTGDIQSAPKDFVVHVSVTPYPVCLPCASCF